MVILGAASIAVLFAPVRDRVRTEVDRRVFGDVADPAEAIVRLASSWGDDSSCGRQTQGAPSSPPGFRSDE